MSSHVCCFSWLTAIALLDYFAKCAAFFPSSITEYFHNLLAIHRQAGLDGWEKLFDVRSFHRVVPYLLPSLQFTFDYLTTRFNSGSTLESPAACFAWLSATFRPPRKPSVPIWTLVHLRLNLTQFTFRSLQIRCLMFSTETRCFRRSFTSFSAIWLSIQIVITVSVIDSFST